MMAWGRFSSRDCKNHTIDDEILRVSRCAVTGAQAVVVSKLGSPQVPWGPGPAGLAATNTYREKSRLGRRSDNGGRGGRARCKSSTQRARPTDLTQTAPVAGWPLLETMLAES
jgi:hypothetical protein